MFLKKINSRLVVNLFSSLVVFYGYYAIINTLLHPHLILEDLHQPYRLLFGFILLYTGIKLKRSRRSAWVVTVVVVTFLMTSYIWGYKNGRIGDIYPAGISGIILLSLILNHKKFASREKILSFRQSITPLLYIVLGVLIYGTLGFLLMDKSIYGQEFSVSRAFLQTLKELYPFSTELDTSNRLGNLFLLSIPFTGLFVLVSTFWTLYRPVRFKLVKSDEDIERAKQLWKRYSNDTEDWFCFWPDNYRYYFHGESVIAYRVARGVAIALGNPVGKKQDAEACIKEWIQFITLQEWTPAMIHADADTKRFAEASSMKSLTIGGDALVNTDIFVEETSKNKYFRNIKNRIESLGYYFEIIEPPFTTQVMNELRQVSEEWLSRGNRKERQFGLGYFTEEYISLSSVAVIKNTEKEIVAFANLIPTPNPSISSIDLMRFKDTGNSGVMHYLLLNLIAHQKEQGAQRFNLGFVPLAKDSLVQRERVQENLLFTLRLFANRFFAFTGLERFKNTFDPEWSDRYLIYTNNKLTKTLLSLEKLMRLDM